MPKVMAGPSRWPEKGRRGHTAHPPRTTGSGLSSWASHAVCGSIQKGVSYKGCTSNTVIQYAKNNHAIIVYKQVLVITTQPQSRTHQWRGFLQLFVAEAGHEEGEDTLGLVPRGPRLGGGHSQCAQHNTDDLIIMWEIKYESSLPCENLDSIVGLRLSFILIIKSII